MFPYLLTFSLSLLILYLMNIGKRTSYKKMLLGGILVILPLALLGAFRNIDIGTDLQFYAIPIWDYTVGGVKRLRTWTGMEWRSLISY